jgi:hypothetical protein
MAVVVAVQVDANNKESTVPLRYESNVGGYVRAVLYKQIDGITDKFAHQIVNNAGKLVTTYFIDIPEDEWLNRKSEWVTDLQRSLVCNNWSVYKTSLRRKESCTQFSSPSSP